MKILAVFPPYKRIPSDSYGGIEKVALERAEVLKSLGFKVEVVVPEGSKVNFADKIYFIKLLPIDYRAEMSNENILKRAISYLKFLKRTKAFSYNKVYRRISEEIDLDEYDLIINDAFRQEIWNIYAFSKIFPIRKTFQMLHSGLPFIVRLPIRMIPKGIIFGALNSDIYHILKEKGLRAFNLPNGIHIPKDRKPEEPDDYLIFIGRISYWKGPHLAVEISRKLKKKLILIGPIHEEQYFINYIKPYIDNENVKYLGHVSEQEKEEVLKKAIALIFTSIFPDNYPTVLLEALSWGVPVLALEPPRPSGFYDICNSSVCISDKNIDRLTSKWNDILSIDRKSVLEYAINNLSWQSVILRKWMPAIESVLHDFK